MSFLEKLGRVYGQDKVLEINPKTKDLIKSISSICRSLATGQMSLESGNHLRVINSLYNMLLELEQAGVKIDSSLMDLIEEAQANFLAYAVAKTNGLARLQQLRERISGKFELLLR